MPVKKINLKVIWKYRKNYKIVKSSKENGYFFSKKLTHTKKNDNNETNEQEQTISLNPKKNISISQIIYFEQFSNQQSCEKPLKRTENLFSL